MENTIENNTTLENTMDPQIINILNEKFTSEFSETIRYPLHLLTEGSSGIDLSLLHIESEISSGPYGILYQAMYDNQRVCVKIVDIQRKDLDDITNMIAELSILQSFPSDVMIHFIGAAFRKKDNDNIHELLLITEYFPNGMLRSFLQNKTSLSWKVRVQLVLDIAHCIKFLHNQNIIHRDLQTSNIVIDKNHKAKILDLSCACHVKSTSKRDYNYGFQEFIAPECFDSLEQDFSSDIYSFGMILCEMITDRVLSKDFSFRVPHKKYEINKPYIKHNLLGNCPLTLEELAYKCCEHNPKNRLSIDEVIQSLEDLITSDKLDDIVVIRPLEQQQTVSNQVKGTLIAVIAVLFLSPDALLIRLAGDVSNPTVLFYRYMCSVATFSLFALLSHGRNVFIKIIDMGYLGILCSLCLCAANIFFTSAIQNAPAAVALVIIAINPLWSSVFTWLILKEVVPVRTIITCIISIGAIVMIFVTQLQGQSSAEVGMIYAVFSGMTLGLFFVLLRLAQRYQGSAPDMVMTNIFAGIFIGMIALMLGAKPSEVPQSALLYLYLQGFLLIPISFGLLTIAPSYIPASEVSLCMLIETILGPVWVYLGGFEAPPQLTVYGGIVLVTALAGHSILQIREISQNKNRDRENYENVSQSNDIAVDASTIGIQID